MLKDVIGLFGTCGDSKWREEIAIPAIEAAGKKYFNPVVADWNEDAMRNEAAHAASDKVILLVLTGETTGIASMAESGWLALQANLRGQDLILVIEDMPNDPLKAADGSDLRINKTRKLLRQHISALPQGSGVTMCNDIQSAVAKAIALV